MEVVMMTNLGIVMQNVSICLGADIDLSASLADMVGEKLGDVLSRFTQERPPTPAPTFRVKMAAAKAAKRAVATNS